MQRSSKDTKGCSDSANESRLEHLEAVAEAARPLVDRAEGPDYSERLARLRSALRHLDALKPEGKP